MTDTPLFLSPPGRFPCWQVERYNRNIDPSLIRFVKLGAARKHLDQVARWTANGWDPARWVPNDRQVPREVMRQVVGRLVREEVMSQASSRGAAGEVRL